MKRDPKITSKIMSAVKSKDTKPEKILAKALWEKGLRYRKHYKIDGKPDLVFIKKRLAIFVDGDFWHGNNWKIRGLKNLKHELEGYSEYWREKIVNNIKRDKNVNAKLKKEGWRVLRFWESDIINDKDSCVNHIIRHY